jgi:hypothetical protein
MLVSTPPASNFYSSVKEITGKLSTQDQKRVLDFNKTLLSNEEVNVSLPQKSPPSKKISSQRRKHR